MRLRFAVAACLISLLSACAVHTPGGSVIVDPDGHGHGQRHCPPGQAKKGNCRNWPGLALAGRLPARAVNTSKFVARLSCARSVHKPAKSSKRPLLGAAFYVWCYGCLLPVCRLIAPRLYRAMLVTRLGRIKCFVGFTSGPTAFSDIRTRHPAGLSGAFALERVCVWHWFRHCLLLAIFRTKGRNERACSINASALR